MGRPRIFDSLSPRLNKDASTLFHVDAQGVPIEKQHTQKGSTTCGVGLDKSRLAFPQHSYIVNVEFHFIVVGQNSEAFANQRESQLRNQCQRQGQESAVTGVDNCLDLLGLLRRDPAPKLRSAR